MEAIIKKLNNSNKLEAEEINEAFELLLDENTREVEIESFLKALTLEKINADILAIAAKILRKHAKKVEHGIEEILDTCGTGGDKSGFFNFSTAAALVSASEGTYVAKHGNRSISSKSGSTDFLEALGVPVNLNPQEAAAYLRKNHFVYLAAPNYHPTVGRVQKIRRQMKQVTIFNFLGPLLNPAGVTHQLLGVFDDRLRPLMAEALQKLGIKKAWVVCGEGGVDELTLAGVTNISEVTPDNIIEYKISPEDAALRVCDAQYLKGGDSIKNSKILYGVFSKEFFGPIAQGILYNSGACFVIMGKAKNIREGVAIAKQIVDEGRAIDFLERIKNDSRSNN